MKPIHERLGLKTEDELDEYMADNPGAYRKASQKYFEDLADYKAEQRFSTVLNQASLSAAQQILIKTIETDGNNPTDFKAWLQYQKSEGLDLPFNEGSYRLYKQARTDKSDPVLAAQLKSQARQIVFVESGSEVPPDYLNLTEDQIMALSPEKRKAIKEYLIKLKKKQG